MDTKRNMDTTIITGDKVVLRANTTCGGAEVLGVSDDGRFVHVLWLSDGTRDTYPAEWLAKLI